MKLGFLCSTSWSRALSVVLILLPVSSYPSNVESPTIAKPTNESIRYPTPTELFAGIASRHHWQEMQLNRLSEIRAYRLENDGHELLAEEIVKMNYYAPRTKIFTFLSAKGSSLVRHRVFQPLIEDEQRRLQSTSDSDGLITPSNYTLQIIGIDQTGGSDCFLVQASPKRRESQLFEGTIWVDRHDYSIIRISGHLAKSPSFWMKRVDFRRDYKKIKGMWFVSKIEALSEVRIFGSRKLTVDYQNHEVNSD